MRKFAFGLKLTAAGLLMAVVTAAATAMVALLGDSGCLRGAVTHAFLPIPTFRLSADGRVLEFDGPVTYGVAARLERLLDVHGPVRVLHLTSNGGLASEAQRMARAVKGRNLDTYVSSQCASACVDVFLAGRERLIAPSGWLGFHQASLAGPHRPSAAEQDALHSAQAAELVAMGVSESFATKVVATPHRSVWWPSRPELLAERLVTRVVDPSAVATSSRVCRHAPSRADLLARLGGVIYQMGGARAAIRYLDRALQTDPDQPEALQFRAIASFHASQFDRTFADADRLVKLDPRASYAFFMRGRIRVHRGDVAGGIRDLDEALRLGQALLSPRDEAVIRYVRGSAHEQLGAYDAAIADFTKAIALAPTDARFYNARAWAYFKSGKAAKGLPDAESSLKLAPDQAYAFDTRAHIFEALGRREEAIADFRRALAIDPSIEVSREGLRRLGAL